mmetsp:Transcript_38347/g.64419  ORF Transcript_38347/g.64419 Transcript_38347/m.64419 type:complete len:288 (-) Transcript_38347:3092-3955(-)
MSFQRSYFFNPERCMRRIPGEVGRNKSDPNNALESSSGYCYKSKHEGGPHKWRFGLCTQCGIGEGYGKHKGMVRGRFPGCRYGFCCDGGNHKFFFGECRKCGENEILQWDDDRVLAQKASIAFGQTCSIPGLGNNVAAITVAEHFRPQSRSYRTRAPGSEIRKKCPTCDWAWLDRYNKNECPKCSNLLVLNKLVPTRYHPHSAVESQSGSCKEGGLHKWKFGKCGQCGLSEGYGKKPLTAPAFPLSSRINYQGKCHVDGLNHLFKFSMCTKCGTRDSKFVHLPPPSR